MHKRQAIRAAEALWGANFGLRSYKCRKKWCKKEGCTGPVSEIRWHYQVGFYQEASGLLAKSFVVKGEGFSWDDAIEQARA